MTRDDIQVGMIIKDKDDNFFEVMSVPGASGVFIPFAFSLSSGARRKIKLRSVFWNEDRECYAFSWRKSEYYTIYDVELEDYIFVA